MAFAGTFFSLGNSSRVDRSRCAQKKTNVKLALSAAHFFVLRIVWLAHVLGKPLHEISRTDAFSLSFLDFALPNRQSYPATTRYPL
ncbi:hypothetical protein DB347_19945 [Opitutaceae bacterium EW11]|nr:hypothetical protein DB347_19945 [Opitutaceae bacterium EW11]